MLIFGDDVLPSGKQRSEIKKIIYSALQYLITTYNEFAAENGLGPGEPYLTTRGKKRRSTSQELPYTEANAFLISTILHFMLNAKYFPNTPGELSNDNLRVVASQSIEQLLKAFIYKKKSIRSGWSHTLPAMSQEAQGEIYFTWSTIETLVDVIDYSNQIDFLDANLKQSILVCFESVREDLEFYLFDSKNIKIPFIFLHPSISERKLEIYNTCQAFIILGLLNTEKYAEMILTLITLVTNSNLISEIAKNEGYLVKYLLRMSSTGNHNLDDESILPLIVRSIATVFGEYRDAKFLKSTEKAHLRDPWSYLVMADRIEELKKNRTSDGLWGPDGDDYEIYYTERTVEALVSCYYYVTEKDSAEKSRTKSKSFQSFNDEYKGLKE
jgi:hypothetical protein